MKLLGLMAILILPCLSVFSQTCEGGGGIDCSMRDPCMPGDCYNRNECEEIHSPILIDVDGDGFNFSPPGVGVYFDLYGTGSPLFLQWVNAGTDDGFLFIDLNMNETVDDGTELFGNGTTMIIEQVLAPNGFVALAQYDLIELGGNDDGFITDEDDVWSWLYLWFDENADGISTSNEVVPLGQTYLTTLETIPRESKSVDAAGNWLRFWAIARMANTLPRRMLDVFFREIEED
jgi:hypothetical protein